MTTTGLSPLDKLSLFKYMKNIGRAYRKQAMELVSTCRVFVQVQEQTPASDAMLRSVLDVVDYALSSAASQGATRKSSEQVDKNFEAAIKALDEYHVEYHPERSPSNLCDRMAEARENDQSSLTILNRLEETFRPIKPQKKRTVEFLIHKSLPDRHPTIVKQVLCERSHLAEILWNFCRFKGKKERLRLSQNPQFYAPLPEFTNAYGDRFLKEPTEKFWVERVDVLTDNPSGRVYLETARNRRAFGNVYSQNRVIIFKDVCGKLEGESVVGEAFQGAPDTGIWCFKELPQPPTPPRTRSSDLRNHSPTPTAPSTHSVEGVSIQDWRNPIREMLDDLKNGRNVDINVLRITTRPRSMGNRSHSYSAPCSPSPQLFSSSSDVSLSQSLPATPRTGIPEPSAGPPTTPSNYKTSRDTPPSGQSPVVALPQSTPAPSAPNLPSASPPRLAPIVASPAVAPTSPPPQQPRVASPLTRDAKPAPPTTCSAPEIRERGFRGDTSPEAAPSPSRQPIADVAPSGTFTKTKVRSTPTPHAQGSKGGTSGQSSIQSPKPHPEYLRGTSPKPEPAALPPPVPPQADDPTKKRKKNWFQKYVWDYNANA